MNKPESILLQEGEDDNLETDLQTAIGVIFQNSKIPIAPFIGPHLK